MMMILTLSMIRILTWKQYKKWKFLNQATH